MASFEKEKKVGRKEEKKEGRKKERRKERRKEKKVKKERKKEGRKEGRKEKKRKERKKEKRKRKKVVQRCSIKGKRASNTCNIKPLPDFISSLHWIGHESLQQCHNLASHLFSGNPKHISNSRQLLRVPKTV